MSSFFEKFASLCREFGYPNPTNGGRAAGIKSGSVSVWKKHYLNGEEDWLPSFDSMLTISKFFNVSLEWLEGKTDERSLTSSTHSIDSVGKTVSFPIIGSVKAGYGGYAQEIWTDEWETLPVKSLKGYSPDECKVFRVSGDSMLPTFHDGDRVLVHCQQTADSGDTVVVYIGNEEASLKRLRLGFGYVELVPENSEYATKRFEGAEMMKVRIFGKALLLMHEV